MARDLASLAVAILLCVGAISEFAVADAINPVFPVSVTTKLTKGKSYNFRFSLWDQQSDGAMHWAETKRIKLSSLTVRHHVGSVDPAANPMPVQSFASQLYLQVDYQSGSAWKKIGSRTTLSISPYAVHALGIDSVVIDGSQISALTVGSSQLADGAVTASKINGTIPAEKIDAAIGAHPSRTDNPHQVTAAQAGAAQAAHTHTLSGDLSGDTGGSVAVTGLRSRAVSSAAPASGDLLQYDGSSWAPASAAAHAHQAQVIVLKSTGSAAANGTALLAAMNGITDNSSAKPYIIKLDSAFYDLAGETLSLKSYVALQGAGENQTVITSSGDAAVSGATVVLGSRSEVRDLQIKNTGAAAYAIAVYDSGNNAALKNVTLQASGGVNITAALYLTSSAVVTVDTSSLTALAPSAGYIYGAYAGGGSYLTVRNSRVVGSGTTFLVYGIKCTDSSTDCRLSDSALGAYSTSGSSLGISVLSQAKIKVSGGMIESRATGSGMLEGIQLIGAGASEFSGLSMELEANDWIFGLTGSDLSEPAVFRQVSVTTSCPTCSGNAGGSFYNSEVQIYDSRFKISGSTTTTYGLKILDNTTLRLQGVSVEATGSGSLKGVYCNAAAGSPSTLEFHSVDIASRGGTNATGVQSQGCNGTVRAGTIRGENGSGNNRGLYTGGTSPEGSYAFTFDSSQLIGATNTIYSEAQTTTRLGNTQLSGGNRSGGTVACYACYDEAYTAPAIGTCPN